MPRVLSPFLPSPPPLPMNSVQIRAVLTGRDLETYVKYPAFSASFTPMQLASFAFGSSKEIRATKYGMFQAWEYALPDFKWNGGDTSPDGKQAKTVMAISKPVWKYEPSKIQDGVLDSTATTVPPVGFTPVKALKYAQGGVQDGKLEMPAGYPALTSALFAGMSMFVRMDTPFPDTDGKANWFCVIPVAYIVVRENVAFDEENNGNRVTAIYNPGIQMWVADSTTVSRRYLTLWLIVDYQRIRTILIDAQQDPLVYLQLKDTGTPPTSSMERNQTARGYVEVKWPSGSSTITRLPSYHTRGSLQLTDSIELNVEHYITFKRTPKRSLAQENTPPSLVIPHSKLAVVLNGEWYEYDIPYVLLDDTTNASGKKYADSHAMIEAILPALRDGYDLAVSAYSMPTTVSVPYYYVNNSRPAIAITYPVCSRQIAEISIPFSVGYYPLDEQKATAEADVFGFVRPFYLSTAQDQNQAGRQMVMRLRKDYGVVPDDLLLDTFHVYIKNFSTALVLSSMNFRMRGKKSAPRTIAPVDITPYISFASIRSEIVPSELREVQSIMIQLDAIDDHIANQIVDTLMNKSGVFMLELEVFSNMGGIAFSDFQLGGSYHPCAYHRYQLPVGMNKQYRVQLSNRTLTLYAHDWLHFISNIPLRIAPFFDGWCWREAVRFLWELAGLDGNMWLFDDDTSRCQQGPYPKQLDNGGNPIGECPHYKLPIGPMFNPIMTFHPETTIQQAIYAILTLVKRFTYYRWVDVGGGNYQLFLATMPYREIVNQWLDNSVTPIAYLTTGTFSESDLVFMRDSVLGIPYVETSFLVVGQDLWDIRTAGVAAGFNPTGYPVMEARRMNVFGINDPNLSEQYMLGQQSPVFVAVPRPFVQTSPLFVDPHVAGAYLDLLSSTNYPSNQIAATVPLLLFPLGSKIDVTRGQTFYRRCYVAAVEHAIRRGGLSTTQLSLRLVQNV